MRSRAYNPAVADLDAWVLSTAPDAVAYAVSLLRDRAAAEDVVQDCYCRLLQKADVYDLPREVWQDDIEGALNYVKVLPTEGAEALEDRVEGVPHFRQPAPAK